MIGDSGGPLYLWDKDKGKGRKEKRATIIGVVSRGTGCANFNKPGIFTKIQHHLKWSGRGLTNMQSWQRKSC